MTMTFKIGEVHPNTPHLFADLVELLLLVGYERKDYIHKNDLESILSRSLRSVEEIDEEERYELDSIHASIRNDRIENQLEDVLIHLGYRSKSFPGFYPFTVRGEEICIASKNFTAPQRVYCFLLACSRLRSFSEKGITQKWAKTFTLVCKYAMFGLMPEYASVRIFDANSQDRKEYYGTKLPDALIKLGSDLGVLHINEDECRKQDNSGDAGLDLVGVINFGDGAASSYAILGQCGAQETGWPKKILESHPVRLSSFYTRQFDQPSMMFTPVCYRTGTGEWVNNQNASGVLLLDRLRILFLLSKGNAFREIISSNELVEFEERFSAMILE